MTSFIKFIHLTASTSLLAIIICLIGYSKTSLEYGKILRRNVLLLLLIVTSTATGTLLVYPKHFTFHTPWICAAYMLVACFILVLACLHYLQTRLHIPRVSRILYSLLASILFFLIIDAVTKHTQLLEFVKVIRSPF